MVHGQNCSANPREKRDCACCKHDLNCAGDIITKTTTSPKKMCSFRFQVAVVARRSDREQKRIMKNKTLDRKIHGIQHSLLLILLLLSTLLAACSPGHNGGNVIGFIR